MTNIVKASTICLTFGCAETETHGASTLLQLGTKCAY